MHKGKMHLRGNKKRKHIVCLENDMDFNTAKDRGPQGWQVSKSSPAGTEGDLEGIQWRHLTPILLSGKSHGWRSLIGCSPWGCWESDPTQQLHFHFSFSWIGEGNGNPLQCSCLENPRDGGAWWAAIYGVARSRTRLKRLSSSSNGRFLHGSSLLLSHMT